MSEENIQEEKLTVHEENWAIHSYLGINYIEAKKITDQEERDFLLTLAVYYKQQGEKQAEETKAQEQEMANQFKSMMSNSGKKQS